MGADGCFVFGGGGLGWVGGPSWCFQMFIVLQVCYISCWHWIISEFCMLYTHMAEVINERIWSVYDSNTVTDVDDHRYTTEYLYLWYFWVIRSQFVSKVIRREYHCKHKTNDNVGQLILTRTQIQVSYTHPSIRIIVLHT